MTINELNLQISQLEAELAHAEVHVETALEAEARAVAHTKKAQNAVADIQFQLERRARLREQLTETPKPVDLASPLGTAIQKAVRGCYARQWTAVILDALASPQGLGRFSLTNLSTRELSGFLSIAQSERVWCVLEQHCPVLREDSLGTRLGIPASENVSDTEAETQHPDGLTLEAAIQKAVRGCYAHQWAPKIVHTIERYQADGTGITRNLLSSLRYNKRPLTSAQAERVWSVLYQRCPQVGSSPYAGVYLGMPKA